MKKKNKGLKIFLGILTTLILLIVVFIVLIIKEIIPNPFLDTKDLVCEGRIKTEDYEKKIVYKFDKKTIVEKYVEIIAIKLDSTEETKEKYNELSKTPDIDIKLDLENNSIVASKEYNIELNNGYYGKTKKEIVDIYVNQYNYICE